MPGSGGGKRADSRMNTQVLFASAEVGSLLEFWTAHSRSLAGWQESCAVADHSPEMVWRSVLGVWGPVRLLLSRALDPPMPNLSSPVPVQAVVSLSHLNELRPRLSPSQVDGMLQQIELALRASIQAYHQHAADARTGGRPPLSSAEETWLDEIFRARLLQLELVTRIQALSTRSKMASMERFLRTAGLCLELLIAYTGSVKVNFEAGFLNLVMVYLMFAVLSCHLDRYLAGETGVDAKHRKWLVGRGAAGHRGRGAGAGLRGAAGAGAGGRSCAAGGATAAYCGWHWGWQAMTNPLQGIGGAVQLQVWGDSVSPKLENR